ncbi:MAG: phosphoglycerate mutase, partial [Thermoprotei archaeon]
VISAVNLVKGIGSCAGMKVIEVPGATGYIDTNYEGKADYALKALDEGVELVYIHVEAPDEAGHAGDFELKVKAIEDLDRRLLGRLLDKLDEDAVIAIVSDHLTPISVKTHLKGPIPFAYASAKGSLKEKRKFDEGLTRGVTPISGPSLLKMILGMISREAS